MFFEDLAGHAAAKRALEVAAAGGHSILLVGPRGAGKDSLVKAYGTLRAEAGVWRVENNCHAALGCWCGADNLTCQCSDRAKARYARRLARLAEEYDADLLLEVSKVPVRELDKPREWRSTTADAAKRVSAAAALAIERQGRWNADLDRVEPLLAQLDPPAKHILEKVVRRLGLGIGDTVRVLRVARTIADLAGDTAILCRAVAEAAQYRALLALRGEEAANVCRKVATNSAQEYI